jgi:AcrR family transcriptional regulator
LGITERKERTRQARRRAILDAARDMFVTDGYLNVSIRKIADRIEYSPAAIYSSFAGKDDIFFALAEEGFRLLFESSPDDDPSDPLDSVRRIFWHYYEFSKRHPEYFALMFVGRSVPRISRDWQRFGFVREMKARLERRIERCVDAGLLPAPTPPDAAFRVLAAAMHGPAVLNLCDRVQPGEDVDALARDVLESALAGLGAGVALTFRPLVPPAVPAGAPPVPGHPHASSFSS